PGGAFLLVAASAYAGKTNAADFPLRVHIVDRNGIRHYHGIWQGHAGGTRWRGKGAGRRSGHNDQAGHNELRSQATNTATIDRTKRQKSEKIAA
ncbi:MAG: hypothetical protein WB974_09240, partial [Acidobacteriaceae bacterium]